MSARKFDGEWMPRYGDWWLESERVDALSDGAYRLYDWLLWRQWKHESIPADPSSIVPARFARRWKALWAEVAPFFEVGEDGRLRNETCAAVREDAVWRREKGRLRGRNGAAVTNAKRWGERRSSDRSSDTASDRSSEEQAIAPESLAGRTGPDRTVPDKPPVVPLAGDGPGSRPPAAEPERTPASELSAWWCGRFEAVTGKAYPWRERPDDRAAAGVLELAGGDLARVRDVAERLFADPFHRRTGFDLGTLRSNWAKLLGAKPDPVAPIPVQVVVPERPLWRQLGYASEAEFRDADTLRAQPKPKLLELMHATRNGAAGTAGGVS